MVFRLIAFSMLLASCSTPNDNPSREVDTRPAMPWKSDMVRGASFNSIPDKGILYLGFTNKGNHVAATIGDRNHAIAGPLWYWAISEDGDLILSDRSGKKLATMELIEYSPRKVVVRNGGEITHYKRTKK